MKRNITIIIAIAVITMISLSVTAIPKVQSQTILKDNGKLMDTFKGITRNDFDKAKEFLNKIDFEYKEKSNIKTLDYEIGNSIDRLNIENQFCASQSLIILPIILIGFIIGLVTYKPAFIVSLPFSVILGIFFSFIFFMTTQNLIYAISAGLVFGGLILIGGAFWPITCALLCLVNLV